MAALGLAMEAVYAMGLVVRPERSRLRLGRDSMLALVLFALGIAGLFVVSR